MSRRTDSGYAELAQQKYFDSGNYVATGVIHEPMHHLIGIIKITRIKGRCSFAWFLAS